MSSKFEMKKIEGAEKSGLFSDVAQMIDTCVQRTQAFLQEMAVQPTPAPVLAEVHRRL